jgi:putative transposase
MPRHLRCVCAGVAHHVTQRGVNRTDVFFSQQDRRVYLELLAENVQPAKVRVLAWCLMTNHVHWVVVPEQEDSLAVLFRRVHGRYAQYLNARRLRSGHLWQNRFFSCPLALERAPVAIRYVECNPVRAGLVQDAAEYEWSSAAAHLTGPNLDRKSLLDWEYWQNCGGAEYWRTLLSVPEPARDSGELRRATYAGSPVGSEQFVATLEQKFGRRWRIPGRPKKPAAKQQKEAERSGTFSKIA